MRVLFFFYLVTAPFFNLFCQSNNSSFTKNLSGELVDFETNKKLAGANVHIVDYDKYLVTDYRGQFKFKAHTDNITLKFSYVGFQDFYLHINTSKYDGVFQTIKLKRGTLELDEVIIQNDAEANIKSTDIGKSVISIVKLKQLPKLLGELDVLKSISLLPGVSTIGEASSGLNVRGGGFDQNLVLLGGGILYNPYHLFGFFSSINASLVNNVTLYKGVIPTQYGGRASSVIDVSYKAGDYKKWKKTIGIGLLSSNFSVEGPIIKDKLSIILATRFSYVNWILKTIKDEEIQNSSANFNDINGKIDYKFNENNSFSLSYYKSNDNFQLASDTTNSWSNENYNFSWKHLFNDKLSSNFLASNSVYDFSLLNESGLNDFTLRSKIHDFSSKIDVNYSATKSEYKLGAELKTIKINPGDLTLNSEESSNKFIEAEQSLDYSFFFYNNHKVGEKFEISYGVRYNTYKYLGPNSVDQYKEIVPISSTTVTSVENYDDGEVIKKYTSLAPRVGVRYSITPNVSIKAGYNRMNQFIHLISNTSSVSPVNIWKLSDQYIKPQKVSQLLLGVFKNSASTIYEFSLEGYYKIIDDVVEYKDGAELILNEHIETELLNGIGKAYGVELLAKKKIGDFTGWVSYTYSRSIRKVENPFVENQVNNGKWYSSNFDKPHDLTVVTNYKPDKKVTFSTVFTYSSGRPVTFPTSKFRYLGQNLAYFNSRNKDRIPTYHRLDLSLTLKLKSNKNLLSGDLTLAVYNVYGRANAYSIYFDDVENAPPQAFKLSVLSSPIPSISYNVNF